MFLFHYNQAGVRRMNQQLPINVLRQGRVKYFSINYTQHKNFSQEYKDFSQEGIVDNFLEAVYNRFIPDDKYKIQGYAEIINQQQGETIVSENTRVWLTNVYTAKHFNPYVRNAIKNDILKRIIINQETGSSWVLKRFQRLQIMTTSTKNLKPVILNAVFFQLIKMDFTVKEAMEDGPLVFSDDEEEEKTSGELDDFIDNGPQPEEDVSFYRQLDPENINDYSRINGQTRNPVETIYEDDTPFYGR